VISSRKFSSFRLFSVSGGYRLRGHRRGLQLFDQRLRAAHVVAELAVLVFALLLVLPEPPVFAGEQTFERVVRHHHDEVVDLSGSGEATYG
jgi:hypothetical protein